MTTRDETSRGPSDDFSDEDLSTYYRENMPESSPGSLDNIVLRQAKTAVKSKRSDRLFSSLWRPVTFVATLGISLAIVLQFNETWLFGNVPADEPRNAAGELSDVIEGSAERVRMQTDTAADGLNLGSPNPGARSGIVYPADTDSSTLPANRRFCEIAQTKSANDWWECILRLERNDKATAAATEREMMIEVFPDFTPPH